MLVEEAFKWTNNLTNVTADVLRQHPDILPMLRMTAAPPIARDRLIGLTGVSKNLVGTMEAKGRLPSGMSVAVINRSLQQIGQMIIQLADRDLFTWLDDHHIPTETELYRAAIIVAGIAFAAVMYLPESRGAGAECARGRRPPVAGSPAWACRPC